MSAPDPFDNRNGEMELRQGSIRSIDVVVLRTPNSGQMKDL
jgi:hypothetical protein